MPTGARGGGSENVLSLLATTETVGRSGLYPCAVRTHSLTTIQQPLATYPSSSLGKPRRENVHNNSEKPSNVVHQATSINRDFPLLQVYLPSRGTDRVPKPACLSPIFLQGIATSTSDAVSLSKVSNRV